MGTAFGRPADRFSLSSHNAHLVTETELNDFTIEKTSRPAIAISSSLIPGKLSDREQCPPSVPLRATHFRAALIGLIMAECDLAQPIEAPDDRWREGEASR
jgi:hypothetical protein